MVRWRLIVKDCAPKKIRHIAVEDNTAATYLWRLEMEPRACNIIKTEKVQPRLQYYCNRLLRMEQKMICTTSRRCATRRKSK